MAEPAMTPAGWAQPQVLWLPGWGWSPAGAWRLVAAGSPPLPRAPIVSCSRIRQRART
jgi:hypothetical protein